MAQYVNDDDYILAIKAAFSEENRMLKGWKGRRVSAFRKQSSATIATVSTTIEDTQTKILASLVPDEVLIDPKDYTKKEYQACILVGDVSGFTELCEHYNQAGKGGPSRLTTVLNAYLGTMVQEIMSYGGDVLKFSGDAFLAMWKDEGMALKDCIHKAIDCAIVIQKDYGRYHTDVGTSLRVKLIIAASPVMFSLIGDENSAHYIVVGEAIFIAKNVEKISRAGDVLVARSAFNYVGVNDYLHDEKETSDFVKVLGVGTTWRRININWKQHNIKTQDKDASSDEDSILSREENFSLRPVIAKILGIKNDVFRKFIIAPVMKVIEDMEPLQYLTEMRQVVIVFINIVVKTRLSLSVLVDIIDICYKIICKNVRKYKGCLNKLSMFDKDLMCVLIFGLRGFKQELECQAALRCCSECQKEISILRHIITVSCGVTTGKTYCGVVGHTLRREYTVIGATVNKAARMMMAYVNMVSCDSQTYLHSKMDSVNFVLQEYRPLKGIWNPGPIYQYVEIKKSEKPVPVLNPYPILDREKEISTLKTLYSEWTTAYKFISLKYRLIVIKSDARQGKTRVMEEFIYMVEPDIPILQLNTSYGETNHKYSGMRKILYPVMNFATHLLAVDREEVLNKHLADLKIPDFMCVLNELFEVNFPESEMCKNFSWYERKTALKKVLGQLCYRIFTTKWVITFDTADYVDEDSWSLLPILLSLQNIFFVVTLRAQHKFPAQAAKVLEHRTTKIIQLESINKMYLAALACQLLDIYAIPSDLENNGNPGWVEGYLKSLLEANGIMITYIDHEEIHKQGLVIPPLYMMKRLTTEETQKWKEIMEEDVQSYNDYIDNWNMFIDSCRDSFMDVNIRAQIDRKIMKKHQLPVCFIMPQFNINEVDSEQSQDIHIIKAFDSLTYFEQVILKCSAVLGEMFLREKLLFVMSAKESQQFALAIKTLFEIRVLCCAKGNFLKGGNYVLQRYNCQDPTKDLRVKCYCLGIYLEDYAEDLPKYASCRYLQFRSSYFKNTTYNLLTDMQKKEFHERALVYLTNETRRCRACGNGFFNQILIPTDQERHKIFRSKGFLRRGFSPYFGYSMAEHQSSSRLSAPVSVSEGTTVLSHSHSVTSFLDFVPSDRAEEKYWMDDFCMEKGIKKKYLDDMGCTGLGTINELQHSLSLTRTFSIYDFAECECSLILSSMYGEMIKHCRESRKYVQMFNAISDYSKICIEHQNAMEAIKVLKQGLTSLENILEEMPTEFEALEWKVPLIEAEFLSLMGHSLLDLNQYEGAIKNFLSALEKFGRPFPETNLSIKFSLFRKKFKQKLKFYLRPDSFQKQMDSYDAKYRNNVAHCLYGLAKAFMVSCPDRSPKNKKATMQKAELAVIWALNHALEAEKYFLTICECFTLLLKIAKNNEDRLWCTALEVHALRYCHKKTSEVEQYELKAVAILYTQIFINRSWRSLLMEALNLGYIILRLAVNINYSEIILTVLPRLTVLSIIKLFFEDAVSFLHELDFYTAESDLVEYRIDYYNVCLRLHLETGYYVVPFEDCEKYFAKKDIEDIRGKDSSSSRRFTILIWVWHMRNKHWDYEHLINQYTQKDNMWPFEQSEYNIFNLLFLIEGHLIIMANKRHKINVEEMAKIDYKIKLIFKRVERSICFEKIAYPRWAHLKAYYKLLTESEEAALSLLKKAKTMAQKHGNTLELSWIDHSERVWTHNISSIARDLWCEKSEPDKRLSHRDFEMNNRKVIHFSFRVP